MVLATNRQRGIGCECVAGLGDPALAAEHLAREYQGLGARAAGDETAVHQQLINSDPQG